MATSRNRDYSAPPEGIKNVAALYAWDSTKVITGAENPQTGAWSAVELDPNGLLKISPFSGSFSTNFNVITGTQIQIPVGVKSYSVGVVSGVAFINGMQASSSFSYNGGGYDNFYLSTPINVGCTGGRTIVIWEV